MNTVISEVLYDIFHILSGFVSIYPLAMSIVWITGGLFFYKAYEKKTESINSFPPDYWPPATILVPCHNESKTIELTCRNLAALDYPDYHVLFIDDASSDNTVEVIKRYTSNIPIFHLLSLEENLGKAGALNTALDLVSTPLVMILDADTILKEDGLKWFTRCFMSNGNIAAVTGNPIPLNRKNFLSNFQTVEFMSIIGLIKRSQRFIGQVFTISGCATMFKTRILRQAGGFSPRTATEDIDITWRIQRLLYEIWFEPNALAFIQVPLKIRDYWKQRKRWAIGGWHFLRTHKNIFLYWKLRRLWLIYFDFILAYIWAFCFVITFSAWFIHKINGLFLGVFDIPVWSSTIIMLICILQMHIAVIINAKYDKSLKNAFFWAPWYPILFFMVGTILVVQTAPKGLFGSLKHSGKWRSPSRDVL